MNVFILLEEYCRMITCQILTRSVPPDSDRT